MIILTRDGKSRDMSWSRDGLDAHFYFFSVLVLVLVLRKVFSTSVARNVLTA